MLASYSDKRFPSLIEQGIKIHTLREDVHNRWKPGMSIQHWMHNPRVVSKNPYQFCKGKYDKCLSTQRVVMFIAFGFFEVWIDRRQLLPHELLTLARNDGFDTVDQFAEWFFPEADDYTDVIVKRLKLIHWTDFKY